MAEKTLKALIDTLPQTGTVEWIGIRPEKRAELEVVEEIKAIEGEGLAGDHYRGKNGNRQVTLIQKEHLDGVANILDKASIDPALCRRNIVVSGINLLAFKNRQFQVGEAVFEMTGPCEPCSRMEENLGPGGYNAMRGHGGVCTRIVKGGVIRKGDAVSLLNE